MPSYVSLYLLHQYSGEQSHVWKRKKRKSFEFWGPRGRWAKPRGKIQARSPCPSVSCLPGKHLHKLLAFKTRQLVPMYFRLAGPSRNWDSICFVLFSRLSSEPLHITCLALMMLLIKCSRSVGGFAWQAWCLSFSEISPPLALSTSHSPTQQHCALDAQPVNSSLANYHLWLPYKTGLDPHHCCKHWLLFHDSLSRLFCLFPSFTITPLSSSHHPFCIFVHFTRLSWIVLSSSQSTEYPEGLEFSDCIFRLSLWMEYATATWRVVW